MIDRTTVLHKGSMRLLAVAMIMALMSAFVAAPLVASADEADDDAATDATVSVTGTGTLSDGTEVTLDGDLAVDDITNENGQLVAVGMLTGTLTDVTGAVLDTVDGLPVELPLVEAGADCAALHLGLGPLDLDALGTSVHLDAIGLDVTSDELSGGLLGGVLCTVGNLLDSTVNSNVLAMLLNLVFSMLG